MGTLRSAAGEVVSGASRSLLLFLVIGLAFAAQADAAGQPEIPAVWVTNVTEASGTLRAEIDPEGLSTRYQFEYLALAAYEANLGAGLGAFDGAAAVPSSPAGVGSGTAPIAVAFTLVAPVHPLAPGTAYAYRATATNSSGSTSTGARVFQTRSGAPPAGLPDARGWELVSPVDKGGGAVGAPEAIFGGGDFQAAASGGSFTFSSTSSFGEAAGAPTASQYLATRGSTGWTTRNVSAPLEAGGYGQAPDGVPFRVFSGDLSRALMLEGDRCTVEGTCPAHYSLWEGGAFSLLATLPGLRLEGAAPDLRHAVFAADSGLYEWGPGGLEALSTTPDTHLAASIGAISGDGRRVYFTQGGGLYLHEGAATMQLDGVLGGGAAFQAASTDGSVAFFTKDGHIYRYVAAGAPVDITPTGGVIGLLAVSPSGADIYYQDAAGLWRWHEGILTEIASGDVAAPGDYPPATATVRLDAAGTVLAFLSDAPLGYDNTDAETGLPDTELYVYDADTATLLCASCNPSSERPTGSTSIPGAPRNGTLALYRPRVLSPDGRRLFFDTTDALVSSDTDSATDVYEWEVDGEGNCAEAPGCLGLISGGRGEGGRLLDASESGGAVFFLTGDSLVGTDPGSMDVYDAAVGGGFPEPEAPFVCKGDACQALPSPPEDPGPGTLVPTAGNPPSKVEEVKEPRRCPKGKVRRNGFCLRRLHHGHGGHRHARRHDHHRGGKRAL